MNRKDLNSLKHPRRAVNYAKCGQLLLRRSGVQIPAVAPIEIRYLAVNLGPLDFKIGGFLACLGMVGWRRRRQFAADGNIIVHPFGAAGAVFST